MVAMLTKNKNIGCLGGEIVFNKAGEKSKVIGQNLKGSYIAATKENKRKKCDFLSTANCIVRKDTIKKTNGFDPYYFYPMEDTDFGISIKRLGYDNITNFDIGALHKYSKSARLNRVYTLYKTKTRFLIKNYSTKKAIMSIPKDIEESIVIPIQNLLYRNIATKKENRNSKEETIGPMEQNTLYKILGFISIPFLLSGAYIWNIVHLNQTLNSRNKNFLEEKNMKEYEKSL
jgi:GT2 family glycosyltransferase